MALEALFENPLFLIPVMAGIIFVMAGLVLFKFPPKEINSLYGYRTKNSMKDQDSWDFAQRYSSTELMKFGGLLTLTAVIGIFFNPGGKIAMFLGLGLMILIVVIILIRVEKAIKSRRPK